MTKRYLTAESVRAGHSDKLCDYIADSILDVCLHNDPQSRVACEVLATKGKIVVAGEISSKHDVYVKPIVRSALLSTGYIPSQYTIDSLLHRQSDEIAAGVEHSFESRSDITNNHDLYDAIGAGDQGTVYGYATDESTQYLPLPYVIATQLCQALDGNQQTNAVKSLLPDGKAQVTLAYRGNKPVSIESIVVSVQHTPSTTNAMLFADVWENIIIPVCKQYSFFDPSDADPVFVNPAGSFTHGGPAADTGLTGRKLMVDTYGGLARHGGGALCGKDMTKVDRSGAYMARYIAKTIVKAGLARRCEVSISYGIGIARPLAIGVDTFGTGTIGDGLLRKVVYKTFDARPAAINQLFRSDSLRFADTSRYGHFTNPEYPWEKISEETITSLLQHIQ